MGNKVCGGAGPWEPLAQKEGVDKQGWTVWDNKVLLRQASKKYKRPVTLALGSPVPFNETAGWYAPQGQDHWFEIPLTTPAIEKDLGFFVTGRLFTTRMPRCLDDPQGANGDTGEATCKKRLENRIMQNNLKAVFVLVEEHETVKGKSTQLFDFYKSHGLEVYHRPIEDFNCPTYEVERKQIEDLNMCLMAGKNCLIHCWGGSGRTGTVLIGAMANMGISNPIPYARRAKSVYLDIAEQEQFVSTQRIIITEKMAKNCPKLTKHIVFDHIADLCSAEGPLVPVHGSMQETEVRALRDLFELADINGDGALNTQEIIDMVLQLFDEERQHEITADRLHKVLAQVHNDCKGAHERQIEFEHFVKLMELNTPTHQKCFKALTKQQTGH